LCVPNVIPNAPPPPPWAKAVLDNKAVAKTAIITFALTVGKIIFASLGFILHAAVDRLKATRSVYNRAAMAGPKIWRTRAAELTTPCSRFSATSVTFGSAR
jgi:hypothetical protein